MGLERRRGRGDGRAARLGGGLTAPRATTRSTAASATPRSSRPHGDAVPAAPPPAHRRRDALEIVRHTCEAWPGAGSTTSSPAASPVTASTSVVGTALREDALRQRPPAARLHHAVAAHRRLRWRGAWPPRRRGSWRTCSTRRFVSSLDADTGGRRAPPTCWTPTSCVTCSATADGAWAADLFDVTPAGTFEHGTERAAARPRRRRPPTPRSSRRFGRRPGARCWPPGSAGSAGPRRQGGRRAGTASRSPRSSSSSPAWTRRLGRPERPRRPNGQRRRRAPGRGAAGGGSGCAGSPATASSAHRPASSTTTAAWPRPSVRCTSSPASLAGSTWPRVLVHAALEHFDDGDGGFPTRRTTPSSSSPARPTRPTTRTRPGCSAMIAALTSIGVDRRGALPRTAAERALAAVAPLIGRHARFAGYAAATAEALLAGPPRSPSPGDVPAGRRRPGHPTRWSARPGSSRRRAR